MVPRARRALSRPQSGEIVRWFGASVDIQDRKISEERQAFLLGLSDALRVLADPAEIIAAAAEALGRRLGAGQVIYAETDLSVEHVTIGHEWNDGSIPSNARRHRLDDFGRVFVEDLKRGRTTVFEDVALDSRTSSPEAQATFARASIKALVNVPLTKNGRMVAVLGVHSAAPRVWRPEEVLIAEEVAERTWAALERARAEATLRESEERYRLILEETRDYAIFTTDAEGRIDTWPAGAQAVFGWSAHEAIGQPSDITFTPEDRAGGEPQREFGKAQEAGSAPNVSWQMRKDGSRVFIDGSAQRLETADGRFRGVLKIGRDTTEQRRKDEALRESEERFRSFAENSADTLWIVDADTGRLEYLSPAFEAMWGESRDAVMADLSRWSALVHPDDRVRAASGMRRLLAGEVLQQEYRIIRPSDGELRWIQDTGFPILDSEGRVCRVAGVAQDTTARVAAERAIVEGERRMRSLVEGIPELVWRAVDGGKWTWASPQWTAYTGQSEADSHGLGWLAVVHPEDREEAMTAWARAQGTGGFEVVLRLWHAPEGRHRWFQTRATAVRDDAGGVPEWLGASTDIDELRGLQERQRILVSELQHRVRNILAIVRSVARRSSGSSETVDDYAMHLDGRINALARTQAVLTRAPGVGVSLENLIAEELLAYAADDMQVTLSGPEVRLQPKAAETLALAIHELATNAVKYGALSVKSGRVSVSWATLQNGRAPHLNLDWKETGVGVLSPEPRRRGFGQELIERTVPYELGASAELVFEPGGVRCRIDMPMNPRNVVPAGSVARGAETIEAQQPKGEPSARTGV